MSLPGRIPSLDGFRAISILMVVMSHCIDTNSFPKEILPICKYLVNGGLGVRAFFVISGFLITSLLLKEEEKYRSVSLKDFYVRRILRIFPVYFIYILFIYLFHLQNSQTNLSTNNFIAAMTFTTGLWGKGSWLLGHTWSLSVEEQFYIIWPLLFALTSFKSRFYISLWFIILAPFLRIIVYIYWREPFDYLFITQGDAIMVGCFIALYKYKYQVYLQKIVNFKPSIGRLIAFSIIYMCWLLAINHRMGFFIIPFTVTVQAVSIAYLIISFVEIRSGLVYTILNSRIISWIGIMSYSIYIWQQFFLSANEPHYSRWYTTFPQNVICVFVVASISYYGIERPINKWRQYATKRVLQT